MVVSVRARRALVAAVTAPLLAAGCGGAPPQLDSLVPVTTPGGTGEPTPGATPDPDADPDAAPTPDVLLADATALLRDAPLFAMTGSAVGGGQRIEFGYVFAADGDVEGSTVDGGTTLRLRLVSGTSYLLGDDGFWASRLGDEDPDVVAAVQARLAGRWVEASREDALALRDLTRDRLLAEYLPTGPVSATPARLVAGVEAQGLRGAEGVLYVEVGTARPLQVVLDDGSTVTFDLDPPPLSGAPADAIALADLV